MANVIENIIRTRDESTPTLRNVRNEMAAMVTAMTGLTLTAAGAATALVGFGTAAFKAAVDLSKTVEQLDRVSARTGVGIETLQVYRRILEESGASGESLTQALTFLSRAIGTNDPTLRRLGITTKDVGEAFRQLIGILADSTDEALRNEVGMRLMGRGSADVVANAKSMADGFDNMKESLSRSNALITEDLAPSLRTLDGELEKLDRNWKGFWQGLAAAAVPAVTAIISAINTLSTGMRSGLPGGRALAFGMAGAGAGVMAGQAPAADAAAIANARLAAAAMGASDALEGLRGLLRGASAGPGLPGLRAAGGFGSLGIPTRVEEGAPRAADPLHQALGDWRSFISEMRSSTEVLNGFLNATLNGLTAGFTQVFLNLLGSAQTFRSAMVAIFRSLVSEILAQLARMVALRVFSFIFGPIASAVMGAGGGGGGTPSVVGGGGGPRIPRSAAAPVVNIYAIDERSFAEQMRSFGGSITVSERRLASAGAA